ncbi:MAG: RICIN domain-containing protein [Bacteroidota bacterium]|nr:RICIN domain-containing protein [Bacteroidota bacterium]
MHSRTLLIMVVLLFCSFDTIAQEIKGTFAIKNVTTGMLLRVMDANKKNETPIVAYSPTNWKCMTWDFTKVEGNTYTLKNLFTNKTFQPQKPEVTAGIALVQQPREGNSQIQQWEFLSEGSNTYLIRLKGTDLYITPSDSKGTINSQTILAKKDGTKLQQWTIYEQHPEM